MTYNLKHLEGLKLNRLTFIKQADKKDGHRRLLAIFRCECGAEKEVAIYEWVMGAVQSCGCKRRDEARKQQPGAIRAAARHHKSKYEQPVCLLAQYF